MDRLSFLLDRFALSAGVFHTGRICGIHPFDRDERRGHFHLIRQGPVTLAGAGERPLVVTEPTLLFLPRPDAHRLIADERAGADVVCASIRFGGGGRTPITDSLPALVVVPLSELPGSAALLQLLQDEAFGELCGRQAALDRLCELLLIRLLRHCLERGLARGGALAGLADPRLAKALSAVHEKPAHPWQLAEMAALAGMSRARFAAHFRAVTGDTPAAYLAAWRIGLAQAMLRAGRPLKHVATDVGYGSPSALARAFARATGASPIRRASPDRARSQPVARAQTAARDARS